MQVSLEEAREKLPELITLVERGESLTIARHEVGHRDFIRA
jgi:antitoxin (DNA-binding transcriptional repressor) of toxin-antitoxin stability system